MQILDSLIEGAQYLDERDREIFYRAVIEYLYYGIEPDLDGVPKAMFVSSLPCLRNSKARAEAGRKGGSSKRASKSEAKAKQTQSKQQSEEEEDIDTKVSIKDIVEQIISELNAVTGRSFKATNAKTIRLINARLAEGFTLEDFLTVIHNKSNDWLSDSKMSAYLRPETLFGTKFEGYLNQRGVDNESGRDSGAYGSLF